MGKIEKKKIKLQERIEYLENELRDSLTKKTHDSKEIDIATHLSKINELRTQLKLMK